MLGAFRLVCENGMVLGKQFANFSQRHVGANSDGLARNTLLEKLQVMTRSFEDTLPHLQAMSRKELSQPAEVLFSDKKVSLPQYLIDGARENYERDGDNTVWGYYNAMTAAITHQMKRDSMQAKLNYGRIAWRVAQSELKLV